MVKASASDPFRRRNRPLAARGARIHRGRGFEEQHTHFLLGDRPMLDAARHDEQLAFAQLDDAIAEFHAKRTVHDEEQLVLVLVLMPHELTLEFHQLHVLAVELPGDSGVPMVVEERKLICEIDLIH